MYFSGDAPDLWTKSIPAAAVTSTNRTGASDAGLLDCSGCGAGRMSSSTGASRLKSIDPRRPVRRPRWIWNTRSVLLEADETASGGNLDGFGAARDAQL